MPAKNYESHPTDDELEAYARGTLKPEREAGVEKHILGCGACQEEIETTIALIEAFREFRSSDIRSKRRNPF